MSIIPCQHDTILKKRVEDFAEVLKTEAHTLGAHGLSETDFYQGGVFRGAIERIRGQFSATMREKRDFVRLVLNHLKDQGFIREWASSGESNRHDYTITLKSGRVSVVEPKGCLDGNNTTIFERPANAPGMIEMCEQHMHRPPIGAENELIAAGINNMGFETDYGAHERFTAEAWKAYGGL